MSTKEYAGKDLAEIRQYFMEDHQIRYTKVVEDRGSDGFTLPPLTGTGLRRRPKRTGCSSSSWCGPERLVVIGRRSIDSRGA